ncbi:Concanavalin A-like lectin/glucanase, subgroup [Artemisia annua]|uniref:Concanavalin A-like lectin/glucanase, subgroup n=1 Tax=Artemisia annua TaxID=35608 RepID=A0A2U1PUI3_ARTAN|nr:Concanavalin A-like lectin/glucanase, subgroup [Artemisia annua]
MVFERYCHVDGKKIQIMDHAPTKHTSCCDYGYKATLMEAYSNRGTNFDMIIQCLETLDNSVVHPDYHHHRVVLIIATYVASLYLGRQFVSNPKHDCSKERQLSGNNITGRIPDELGNLTSIRTLDHSFNQLHGAIPNSLGKLWMLQHLDISNNNLSGDVLLNGSFPNIPSSSFAGNPNLRVSIATHETPTIPRSRSPSAFMDNGKKAHFCTNNVKITFFTPSTCVTYILGDLL